MAKKKVNNTGDNHKANQNNVNKGTKGVNVISAKKHGNTGKQLNPNQKKTN